MDSDETRALQMVRIHGAALAAVVAVVSVVTQSRRGKNIPMELVEAIRELVQAVRSSSKHWSETLGEKVFEIDGYDDTTKDALFNALYDDEQQARAFIAKPLTLRKQCLERFLSAHFGEFNGLS